MIILSSPTQTTQRFMTTISPELIMSDFYSLFFNYTFSTVVKMEKKESVTRYEERRIYKSNDAKVESEKFLMSTIFKLLWKMTLLFVGLTYKDPSMKIWSLILLSEKLM